VARLIDASVLIGLEWRGEPLAKLALLTAGDLSAMASITASEILVGVHRANSAQIRAARETYVEAIIRRIPIVPFTLEEARVHARLSADLRSAGVSIGSYDQVVAATALRHGFSVFTDNIAEFERVPGLHVERPDW
jgi:predicted nucleic acid-binding protein